MTEKTFHNDQSQAKIKKYSAFFIENIANVYRTGSSNQIFDRLFPFHNNQLPTLLLFVGHHGWFWKSMLLIDFVPLNWDLLLIRPSELRSRVNIFPLGLRQYLNKGISRLLTVFDNKVEHMIVGYLLGCFGFKGILWQQYKLGLKVAFIIDKMVKLILPNSAPAGQGSPKLENPGICSYLCPQFYLQATKVHNNLHSRITLKTNTLLQFSLMCYITSWYLCNT